MTTVEHKGVNGFFGGILSTDFIYEDEQCVAFDEPSNPQAPVHFLVVPKKVIYQLQQATEEDELILGHLLIVARRVAKLKGILESGFRVVMNEGPHSCQTINQFYVQVLGGHLLLVAKKICIERGLDRSGYHVVVDEDYKKKRFKSLHVFGRSLHHMLWPVGPGARL